MTYVIIFVVVFAVIVVVHEWGHFIAAKKMGVQVNEFAIGMGPKLWSKQKDETLYTIRLLPIGGFCAMEGENEQPDEKTVPTEGSLSSKTPMQRIIIFAAGAFMNLVLVWVLLSIYTGYNGYSSNVVKGVIEDSPIAAAGVVAGETILAVDGVNVYTLAEFVAQLTDDKEVYTLTIEGVDGQIRLISVAPVIREGGMQFGFYAETKSLGIFESIWKGLTNSWILVKEVCKGFVSIVTGQVEVKELAGIVGVAQITTEIWDSSVQEGLLNGLMSMVYITALLSANLAVLNLIPFPALDGGRIFFTLIELVRGKPLDANKEAAVHFVGFVLLMVLMVVVFYNDIVRLVA
ncbi:MAG: hypothetical protein BEN18_03110 [Epulopiscium sp. Nuni2H_MBin001]|nr:MAG: hypothetical protein BEN18_03110 [Epulopiscium sp. Nuni2H_MBin001]